MNERNMALRVFNFDNYRAFVRAKLEEGSDQRGYQGTLAKAAGCQPSFFSQVLNTHLHLTPDHAANLAKFWKFNDSEREFFVTLVMAERASSPELKQMCLETLEKLRKADLSGRRIGSDKQIDSEYESVYFTSWILQAVHIAIAVPEFQSIKALADRLSVSHELVSASLNTLARMGLAELKGTRWRIGNRSVHMLKNAPYELSHHHTWRLRAISKAQQGMDEGVRYTSLYALAKKDIARIEEVVRECIEKTRKIVDPSPEEELVCFTCDFFKV